MSRLDVSVIIPWWSSAPRCRWRDAAMYAVLGSLAGDQHDVIIAEWSGDTWCKARAIMDGLNRSSRAIAIVHDADVHVSSGALDMALLAIRRGTAQWAMPHRPNHRLSPESTETLHSVVCTAPMPWRPTLGDMARDLTRGETGGIEQTHPGHAGGGILVARRETLLDVPPDPRFAGWGQEDDAWARALNTLAGSPYRGMAPLWHLWHPPQPRVDRVKGSHENMALYQRYVDASKSGPEAMRRLIGEGWE